VGGSCKTLREEERKRKKNQTQLRLVYPKPKAGKEIHKREATIQAYYY
jgi:hypothetical protein